MWCMKWREVAWNGWAKSMRWIRTWDLLTKSPEAWFLWYNVDKGGVTYDGTAKWSNEYDYSWLIRIDSRKSFASKNQSDDFVWLYLRSCSTILPVPFIAAWNCWVLQDIFLPFSFPTLLKSTAFTTCPRKVHFVVQRAQNSFTNGWTAAKQPENTCGVISYKATVADIVSKTLLVSSRQVFGAEFLEAVAILLFIEATNALAATLIGIWCVCAKYGQKDRSLYLNENIVFLRSEKGAFQPWQKSASYLPWRWLCS